MDSYTPPEILDKQNFQIALNFTLSWKPEVSQEDYDVYRNYRKLLPRTSKMATAAEVEDLYYNLYWYTTSSDLMCLPLAVAVFDSAVDLGVRSALTILQKTLQCVDTDGLLSPVVTETLKSKNNLETAKEFIKNRIGYRFSRLQKNSDEFRYLKSRIYRDLQLMAYIVEQSFECPEKKEQLSIDVIKQLRSHLNNATLELNKMTNIFLTSGQ